MRPGQRPAEAPQEQRPWASSRRLLAGAALNRARVRAAFPPVGFRCGFRCLPPLSRRTNRFSGRTLCAAQWKRFSLAFSLPSSPCLSPPRARPCPAPPSLRPPVFPSPASSPSLSAALGSFAALPLASAAGVWGVVGGGCVGGGGLRVCWGWCAGLFLGPGSSLRRARFSAALAPPAPSLFSGCSLGLPSARSARQCHCGQRAPVRPWTVFRASFHRAPPRALRQTRLRPRTGTSNLARASWATPAPPTVVTLTASTGQAP
jgi:hypothetical protein